MALRFDASVTLDVNSRNVNWVVSGIMAGLVYGFCTAEQDNMTRDLFRSALFGGMIMGLVGNFIKWESAFQSSNSVVKEDGVKVGAIDGAVLGAFAGTALGCLDCVVTILFSRNESPQIINRIMGGCLQGGGPCMLNMKSGMVDGMLVGMLLGAIYGAVQVYRTQETPNTQKAAIDIADWSVHVAVVCALVGALIALAKGI